MPTLETFAVKVVFWPVTAVAGETVPAVRFGMGAGLTVIAVQLLQLLVSSPGAVSAMVPVFAAELLSAQALIYMVPAVEKVMDLVAGAVPPGASALMLPVA